MGKVKLNKHEKNMIFNALKVRLGSERAKLEHYERLNTFDDSKMPEYVMEHLKSDIALIEGILPKLDDAFKDED